MKQSRTAWWAAAAVVAAAAVPASSPAQGPAAEPWSVPRTADGRPDLQGVWANNTATPLERPEALGDKAVLTDEELARLEARYAEIFASGESDAAFADSVFTAALGDDESFSSRDAGTGNYNQFWLVVGPPAGRLAAWATLEVGLAQELPPQTRVDVELRGDAAHLAYRMTDDDTCDGLLPVLAGGEYVIRLDANIEHSGTAAEDRYYAAVWDVRSAELIFTVEDRGPHDVVEAVCRNIIADAASTR